MAKPSDDSVELPAPDSRVGTQLGNYQITGVLGQGGMGVVYEAENVLLKRKAAIKLLTPERAGNERAVKRFLQEAQAAARLNHPNVVAIYDVGIDSPGTSQETVYIAMELVRGGNAEDYLDTHGRFHWKEATRICAEACKALKAAHDAGLVHRDIKPANIMRATDGVIKITDFGLAKLTDGSGANLTGATKILGTPHYLSPEQGRIKPLDGRSDIYSLGASYFAMMTGQPPYDRPGGALEVILAHCNEPVPDPRTIVPDLPEACVAICMKAMAKDPADRYQSAEEMRFDLESVLATATGIDSGSAMAWGRTAGFPAAPVGYPGVSMTGSGSTARLPRVSGAADLPSMRRNALPAGLGISGAPASMTGAYPDTGYVGDTGPYPAPTGGIPPWVWGGAGAAVALLIGAIVWVSLDPFKSSTTMNNPALSDGKPGPDRPPPGRDAGFLDPGKIDTGHSRDAGRRSDGVVSDATIGPLAPEALIAQIKNYEGRRCVVEMTANTGVNRDGSVWYLNSESDYRSPKNFSVVIFQGDRTRCAQTTDYAAFKDKFDKRRVRATGKVSTYVKGGNVSVQITSADIVSIELLN